MERKQVELVLNAATEVVHSLPSPARELMLQVISLCDSLCSEVLALQETVRVLKDEINRLKGEHGRPDIKGKGKGNGNSFDHSSENERKGKKKRKKKGRGKKTVTPNRTEVIKADQSQLPVDAQFKGYDIRIFQGLKIETDNVELKLEIWYSPSQRKTYRAALPAGYNGEFAPSIKALVILLNREAHMTEAAVLRFMKTYGIQMSASTISRMLTRGNDDLHQERKDIMKAGLETMAYHHIDDTGCKVKGVSCYTNIICGPYHTVYSTQSSKDRLTVLKVLCPDELKFTLNQTAIDLMCKNGLSKDKWGQRLQELARDEALTEEEMTKKVNVLLPNPNKQQTNRKIIMEAAALTYYRQHNLAIQCLISDDAGQFKDIALRHALCWIHEGRHYKKLMPIGKHAKTLTEDFITKFWNLYDQLSEYKENPKPDKAKKLEKKFDMLFSTVTGYQPLDQCIARTKGKKANLLVCLWLPFIPLHNNPAELGAREQARIRDIHLHTLTAAGTMAKDTFATITQTARKLGVNIYDYLYDRITQQFKMPSLADCIRVAVAMNTPIPNTS